MLLHYKKNSYNLPIKSFYFSSKTSKYYILTSIGIKVIQLPISYFFKNIDKTSLSIIGISKTMNSFFNVFSNFLVDFYFIRLRIRGLGYR